MNPDETNIANAWLAAAADLSISVIAPFNLEIDDGEKCEFIALIKAFGSPNGTLVCLPEQWDDLGYDSLAEEYGYYCSGLYPVSYSQYNRERFIDTLNDWSWFGDESKTPRWYKVES